MRPIPAALSLILLLAACASSPGGSEAEPSSGGAPSQPADSQPASGEPTPGTALSACELVTPADIEAALSLDAGTVSEGTLEETPTGLDPASNECQYTDESWGGLLVMVTPTDGVNTFDAVTDAFGENAEVIDNVGDGALWFEDNNRGYFLKGSVMVILQVHFVEAPDLLAPTIALGEALVAKI